MRSDRLSRALVIGAEGNIGAPLADHLRSSGYEVLEADIRPGWRADYLVPTSIIHSTCCRPSTGDRTWSSCWQRRSAA